MNGGFVTFHQNFCFTGYDRRIYVAAPFHSCTVLDLQTLGLHVRFEIFTLVKTEFMVCWIVPCGVVVRYCPHGVTTQKTCEY
jgi:hypothetical protein